MREGTIVCLGRLLDRASLPLLTSRLGCTTILGGTAFSVDLIITLVTDTGGFTGDCAGPARSLRLGRGPSPAFGAFSATAASAFEGSHHFFAIIRITSALLLLLLIDELIFLVIISFNVTSVPGGIFPLLLLTRAATATAVLVGCFISIAVLDVLIGLGLVIVVAVVMAPSLLLLAHT